MWWLPPFLVKLGRLGVKDLVTLLCTALTISLFEDNSTISLLEFINMTELSTVTSNLDGGKSEYITGLDLNDFKNKGTGVGLLIILIKCEKLWTI